MVSRFARPELQRNPAVAYGTIALSSEEEGAIQTTNCRDNFVKSGHVVFEICKPTEGATDMLIAGYRIPLGANADGPRNARHNAQ